MVLIGYARCSTDDQDLTAQRQALGELGVDVDRIYLDHGLTGANRDRPGLAQALAAVRSGDTLVVPKLDRLARSVPDARDIGDSLAKRGVALSLGGQIYDPNDPMGKMFFNILATFAEFELDLIRARTREGMAIAKAKGKLRGRQPKLSKKQQTELVRMYNSGEHTSSDLADIFKVSRATIYRTLKRITPTPPEPPANTEPDQPPTGTPSISSADTVVAGKSYPWVVELVPVAGGTPMAWSGHTTETGAERMLASIAKVWPRQGSQIRSRWLWGTAPAEDRQPLFTNRQQVLRHAGDVMCYDSAPDWGDDAVLTSTATDPAKGLVAITIEPGNRPIGEPLNGVYDTTRLDGDDHWHGLYLTDLVTALFGPVGPSQSHIGIDLDHYHFNQILTTIAGPAGTNWTIPLDQVRQGFLATGRFLNLSGS